MADRFQSSYALRPQGPNFDSQVFRPILAPPIIEWATSTWTKKLVDKFIGKGMQVVDGDFTG